MYLCSNTCPDIQFAVHQCAQFTHSPCHSHEVSLLHLCQYLKGAKGPTLKLDCYIDANFAGLWSVEHKNDPVCMKSHTSYCLTLGTYPVLWVLHLQTEIALSTTAAEYIALSQAMCDLLPMWALLQELGTAMSFDFSHPALLHSTVFEDNNGALQLYHSPKITPWTKHIAIKHHHFCSHVGPSKGIDIVKIDTKV